MPASAVAPVLHATHDGPHGVARAVSGRAQVQYPATGEHGRVNEEGQCKEDSAATPEVAYEVPGRAV